MSDARPIPEKIEKRLMELLKMEEFDMQEVELCRATYWSARSDWHITLVNCYDSAIERISK